MQTKRPRHFRRDSTGIPPELQRYAHWGGWRDGHALAFTVDRPGIEGRMLPTCKATGADWKTALRYRFDYDLDGWVFQPFDAPFLFLSLVGAVVKVGAHRGQHRVTPSARDVLAKCGTYAEVAPNETDVTMVVEVDGAWREREVGDRCLPLSAFPSDFPVADYDGEAAHHSALLPVPLTGLVIGLHHRVRFLDVEGGAA